MGAPVDLRLRPLRVYACSGLVFEIRAKWPPHLTPEYRRLLHQAMGAAIVDGLVAIDDPHAGCSVSCIDVKWDDVTSQRAIFLPCNHGGDDRAARTRVEPGEEDR
jgi:hypothetical protein